MKDIRKVKAWILVLHFMSLYAPVYITTFFGLEVRENIRDMNASTTITLIFVISLAISLFTIFFRRSWERIMRYVQLSIMTLFILLILLVDDNTVKLGSSIWLQTLFTGVYVLAIFLPELLLNVLGKTNEYRLKLVGILEKLDNKIEEKEQEMKAKKEEKDVEDIMEEVAAKPVEPEVEAVPEVEEKPEEEELPEVEDKKEE